MVFLFVVLAVIVFWKGIKAALEFLFVIFIIALIASGACSEKKSVPPLEEIHQENLDKQLTEATPVIHNLMTPEEQAAEYSRD